MQVEFYIKGDVALYYDCDQASIPRQGDGIMIDGELFKVFTVIWNYSDRVIKITLERID